MKVSTFFKTLNKKIEKYNKLTSNPFEKPLPIILVWVEDCSSNKFNPESKYDINK